jgi:hypothetical protein
LRPWIPICAASLLCAAGLGAGGWLWARYSYAWTVTPRKLRKAALSGEGGAWEGAYVAVSGDEVYPDLPVGRRWLLVVETGTPLVGIALTVEEMTRGSPDDEAVEAALNSLLEGERAAVRVLIPGSGRGGRRGPAWLGRVVHGPGGLAVDATVGRWHPAGVAGVVAAACGLLALAGTASWLYARRAGKVRARRIAKAFGLALATEVAVYALCIVWVFANTFLPILLMAMTHPTVLLFFLIDVRSSIAIPVSIGANVAALTLLWRYILSRRARAAAEPGRTEGGG